MATGASKADFDAVVVGAGFAGLYAIYRLRDVLGLSVQGYEAGGDVGGTWYWNCYPGARCDVESYVYCYSFDKELLQEWNWSGKYPERPEIRKYLSHVADRHDLRRNIQFDTRVTAARFCEANNRWEIETDEGNKVTARFFVTGVGCLSVRQIPRLHGLDRFEGDWYHTGQWPQGGVDLAGKRVAVIGTGSSGVQSIPVIAREAAHVCVFQRTPNYSVPARHYTVDEKFLADVKSRYGEIWERTHSSFSGVPYVATETSLLELNDEEREGVLESWWRQGGFAFAAGCPDILSDRRTNDVIAEFIRSKIRETVKDPETAEALVPTDHPYATKRPIIDTDYYETYNRDNVALVDVRHEPIREITPEGIRTDEREYAFDVIVFATGYDAITGALDRIDIRGRGGRSLKEKWGSGPVTYLGLAVADFPNMFIVTGPLSPSVLVNVPVQIEHDVEWIAGAIDHMRERSVSVIEADPEAEREWLTHVLGLAEQCPLYFYANSWYLGANTPDKPRVFPLYTGGWESYRRKCQEVTSGGYRGFVFGGSRGGGTRPSIASSAETKREGSVPLLPVTDSTR